MMMMVMMVIGMTRAMIIVTLMATGIMMRVVVGYVETYVDGTCAGYGYDDSLW